MVIVVLAAGHGRRLGAAGGLGPKWLVDVGGSPIADRHLTAVEQTLGPDTDVLVVVGHNAARVERYCDEYADRRPLRPRLVLNEQHAERNNWYSLLLALDALEGTLSPDHVVVILNSDLFAAPEWIGELLGDAVGLCHAPGFLAVDVVRPLTDEAMKVAAGPLDAAGRRWCTGIGKVGVREPVGEYVGVSALTSSGREIVHDTLRTFAERADRTDAWYEHAFQEVSASVPFLVVRPTPSSAWVEIDDEDDLVAAARLATALVKDRATENAAAGSRPPRRAPHTPES